MLENEYLDPVDELNDDIMAQEFSVRERCQQFGISLENVRYRIGIDRFKWLSLLILLKLKNDKKIFDELSLNLFFEKIIPRIPKIEYKNPLACVLVYYSCIQNNFLFEIDNEKIKYIQNDLYPDNEFLFQDHGLKLYDLIRYIRLFESIFTKK